MSVSLEPFCSELGKCLSRNKVIGISCLFKSRWKLQLASIEITLTAKGQGFLSKRFLICFTFLQ